MLRVVLSFWLVFSALLLSAQTEDGWTMLEGNRFTEAKRLFEHQFAEGDRSEATLCGLLFLSETTRDYDPYCRYAAELVKHHPQAPYVWLFGHLNPASVPADLPQTLQIPQRIREADSLFFHRKFEASRALNRTLVPDWPWYVTGPFSNVGGSGFVETAEPETRPFNPRDSFQTASGIRVGWLPLVQTQPGAQVSFLRLPLLDDYAVYFAHTSLVCPQTREVALHITRSEPLEIRLNGHLLASLPKPGIPEAWDAETLYFTLPEGTHSLMVKLAEFPADPVDAGLQLAFHERENEGDDWQQTKRRLRDPEAEEQNLPNERFAGTGFILRLCDPVTGALLTDIRPGRAEDHRTHATPPSDLRYSPAPYLDYFQRQETAHPGQSWRLYLLSKAYARENRNEAGEEHLAAALRMHPASDFHRYLLAKFYDLNGKPERAEGLLSAMDSTTAPTFAERYVRLLKIDKDKDGEAYQSALTELLTLSPSNGLILDRYLKYLTEKGRNDEARDFVRQFLSDHHDPKWEKRLSGYLKETSYKPSSSRQLSDAERERTYRKARHQLRQTFDLDAYETVLAHHKRKDQPKDVLQTYNDILREAPWMLWYGYEKAVYLFEKERFDEALATIDQLLVMEPYHPDLHELRGDVLFEMKANGEALQAYRRALKLAGETAYGLDEKIEKLAGKKSFKGFFSQEPAFPDRSWLTAYTGSESVIESYVQHSVFFPEENRLESRRKVVIHILNDAGAKRWTEADLRQLGNITSARVLKKDGSSTSPDLGWGMAVFKSLQAGDVIVVEGQSESSMPNDIRGEFLDINLISWQAPVHHAEVELLLPDTMPLYAACNRLDCAYQTRDSTSMRLYRWQWNDLPKTEEEAGAPINFDGLAWLMLGNAPDWSAIVQWYDRVTYARSEPNYEVLETYRSLLHPSMTEEEKVQALHHFLTSEISYSYVPFLNSNYVPKKSGATLSSKIGDCKDVATLMISLLREAGIPAWYTLVSTHNFSNREPRPTIYVFNHAIVAYQLSDGVLRFADLTTDYYPTGVLPDNDCDAWGLVIRPGEKHLRKLPNHALDPAVSGIQADVSARLETDHTVVLACHFSLTGTVAGNWREALLRSTDGDRLKTLSEYFGGGVLSPLSVDTFVFHALDSFDAALALDLRIRAYRQLDEVADFRIMPLPLPLSLPVHKALFANRRYNDLDLDAFFDLSPTTETIELELPAGFELVEIPKNIHINNQFGTYRLDFERTVKGVTIRRHLVFNTRFINHADFHDFKTFYLDILDGDDTKLVLKSAPAAEQARK